MSSEFRIIRYKLDEVGTALRRLAPRIEVEMPDGDIVSAASSSEGADSSTSFVLSGGHNVFTVTNGELAASLILQCKNVGIPLPRTGKKEIYVSAKFIELRIGMHHQTITKGHDLSFHVENWPSTA